MTTRTLAHAIGFTEGPLWTSTGRLLVTSMSRGLLYEVSLAGAEPAVAAETGGGPNGLAEDATGVVFVAQNGNATIQSRSLRPVEAGIQALLGTEVRDAVGGCTAPNDCAVGPGGRLWFTDPPGRVCTFDPRSGAVAETIVGVGFPNGLAFADEETLLLADTETHRILRYRCDVGSAREAGVFAELPGTGPDGIAVDRDGRLYVAAFETNEVIVLDPGGVVEERIQLPGARPTNLCFAGEALDVLVVTCASGGRVLAFEDRFPGRRPQALA
ncbi:MAG: SMP-30/gluconolactonase/LRE family protein [Gaiellales bacterium]